LDEIQGQKLQCVLRFTDYTNFSVSSIAEKLENPCTGVHIFTFAPKYVYRLIWLLCQSRPISNFQLK